VRAVRRVVDLSRPTSRSVFEERFDAARMTRDYLDVYRRLIDHRRDLWSSLGLMKSSVAVPVARTPKLRSPAMLAGSVTS
jgi:hypothetical protein